MDDEPDDATLMLHGDPSLVERPFEGLKVRFVGTTWTGPIEAPESAIEAARHKDVWVTEREREDAAKAWAEISSLPALFRKALMSGVSTPALGAWVKPVEEPRVS